MTDTTRQPISAAALRDVVARILVGAGSTPQEARPGRGEPGAGQSQRPRFARRGHGAPVRGCGASGRPRAERRGHGCHGHRHDAGAARESGLRPGGWRAGDGAGHAACHTHGSCIMTLSNAHHLGRIGHFAEMAVAQGLVALHFVNVLSRAVVAPWGGADGRFGTNPCCIGIPLTRRRPSAAQRRAASRKPGPLGGQRGARSGRRRGAFHSGFRHQPRRAGQDARGLQQGGNGGPRHAHRRTRPPDDRPRGRRGAAKQRLARSLADLRRIQGLRHGRGVRTAGRRPQRRRDLAPEQRPCGARGAERHADDTDRPGPAGHQGRVRAARPWRSWTGCAPARWHPGSSRC